MRLIFLISWFLFRILDCRYGWLVRFKSSRGTLHSRKFIHRKLNFIGFFIWQTWNRVKINLYEIVHNFNHKNVEPSSLFSSHMKWVYGLYNIFWFHLISVNFYVWTTMLLRQAIFWMNGRVLWQNAMSHSRIPITLGFRMAKIFDVFIRNTIVILANVAFEVKCKIFEYTKNTLISISATASFLIQYT